MSEEPNGKARLVSALDVRQYLRYGLGTGIAVAVATYLLFVAGGGSLTTQALYLLLTVVIALTTAAVVTTLLVGAEAYKLHREQTPDDR